MDPIFWWGLAVGTPALLYGLRQAIRVAMQDPTRFVNYLLNIGAGLLLLSGAAGIVLTIVGFLATVAPPQK